MKLIRPYTETEKAPDPFGVKQIRRSALYGFKHIPVTPKLYQSIPAKTTDQDEEEPDNEALPGSC